MGDKIQYQVFVFLFNYGTLQCSIFELSLFKVKKNSDHLDLLIKIRKNPYSSQRKLANELGFSLGKLNYCLKALKNKGLIKIKNFKKSNNKFNYIYIITPKGFSHKAKLTLNFMKIKMKEYDELNKEIKKGYEGS